MALYLANRSGEMDRGAGDMAGGGVKKGLPGSIIIILAFSIMLLLFSG